MNYPFLFAASLALAGTAVHAEFLGTPARVVVYPPSGELRMLSALPLSPEAQAAFDNEFRPNTYFSAFARAKGGGWGWATTTNTLAAAHAIALGECLASNTDCIVVAEIVPQGYRAPQEGDVTLTPEVLNLFLNPASVGADAPAMAMGVSADGAYSLVWGHPDQASADAAAISDCMQHLNQGQPGVPSMPCVVVPGLPGS